MKKALELSIIIPAYNEELHLERCLQSIADQTMLPQEVIVVDNNSSDKTADIAKRFDFVTLVREGNQGIAWARNKGFDSAKGTYFARLDADSILPTNWIQTVADLLEEKSERVITGKGYFYDMPLKSALSAIHSLFYYRINRLLFGSYLAWGSNMVFPAHYWQLVKDDVTTDTNVAEDMDLGFWLGKHIPVDFEPSLSVEVSFRSGKQGVRKGLRYIKYMPDTMKHQKKRVVKRAWFFTVLLGLVFFVPVFLLGLRRYKRR